MLDEFLSSGTMKPQSSTGHFSTFQLIVSLQSLINPLYSLAQHQTKDKMSHEVLNNVQSSLQELVETKTRAKN